MHGVEKGHTEAVEASGTENITQIEIITNSTQFKQTECKCHAVSQENENGNRLTSTTAERCQAQLKIQISHISTSEENLIAPAPTV